MPPKFKNIRIKKPKGGTRMQRVQVLASGKYKFVKNKPRGGKRSSPKKSKPKKSKARRSNPGGGSTSNNRGPGIGASYQAGRAGIAALSPATDVGIAVAAGQPFAVAGKRAADQVMANPSELIAHEIVVGADVAVDKKMGQSAALSRGSLTAIFPEALTAFKSWEDSRTGGSAADKFRRAHRKAMTMQYGYDPIANNQSFSDPDLRTYRIAKHAGQLARWLRGTKKGKPRIKFIRNMTEPVQKLLGKVGLAI